MSPSEDQEPVSTGRERASEGPTEGEPAPLRGVPSSGGFSPSGPFPTGPGPSGPAPVGPARVAIPGRSDGGAPAPPERRPLITSGCSGSAVVLMLVLILLLLAPRIGEQLAYYWARGYARAEAEVHRKLLTDLPEAEHRFPSVVKAVLPSVVGIETTFAEGRIDDEQAFLWPGPQFEERGEGAGVLIDDQGHILTNHHVIRGASRVVVQLNDGRRIEDVAVIAVDRHTDLAVLRIEESGLSPIVWGDSDQLRVGDWVIAVGNPFGLTRTVTAGIISALNRRASLQDGPQYQDFLQSDAAINPGNSGGPLVNMRGELVGINTAIFGRSFQGIGFSIPSNLARDIAKQLIQDRRVSLGWLGVAMQELSRSDARRLGIPRARGALVTQLVPNSPAVDAGIQPGDVIIRWNDTPIESASDLSFAVIRTPPGAEAEVELLRNGESVTLTVTVGERPNF